MKALGYGRPLKIELGAAAHTVVFHTARPDDFGHDRRSDRTANLMLAFDTFGKLPHHVAAIDMGLVRRRRLARLARGHRRAVPASRRGSTARCTRMTCGASARSGVAHAEDIARAETLARVLLEIHAVPGSHPGAYTRAIRDLLGHGEGVFGLVDSLSAGRGAGGAAARDRGGVPRMAMAAARAHAPAAPHARRLPSVQHRVRRRDGLVLLDASAAAKAIRPTTWRARRSIIRSSAIGHRWRRARTLWDRVLARLPRRRHATTCSPRSRRSTAWRALVLASPIWYPHRRRRDRDRILGFAERALAAERFDPAWGLEAMA